MNEIKSGDTYVDLKKGKILYKVYKTEEDMVDLMSSEMKHFYIRKDNLLNKYKKVLILK